MRQIKLAIRQLFGALKHSLSYRISYISYIVSYRKDVVTKQDKTTRRTERQRNAHRVVLCVASRCVVVRHVVSLFAATCRSVTQYAAICRSVPHVAMYCGILRHTAARCGKKRHNVWYRNATHHTASGVLKAKFHYAIQLASNQLASWFASWSATCFG